MNFEKSCICPLNHVSHRAFEFETTHILSVLCGPVRLPASFDPAKHKHVPMEDHEWWKASRAPTKTQVADVLEWGLSLPNDARLLVHCQAGISRSPAMFLAIAAQEIGIKAAERVLMEKAPYCAPNRLIAWYADSILGCDGKLFEVADRITRRVLLEFDPVPPTFAIPDPD